MKHVFFSILPIILAICIYLLLPSSVSDDIKQNKHGTVTCGNGSEMNADLLEQSLQPLKNEGFQVNAGVVGCRKHSQIARFNPNTIYWGVAFSDMLPRVFSYFLPDHVSNFIFSSGSKDAVVFYACTPNPVKYFAVSLYNVIRIWPFSIPGSSVAQPLNHLLLNTSSETVWNQPYAVIVSADSTTIQTIRDRMIKTGIPKEQINTLIIPRDMFKADDFNMVWPLSMFHFWFNLPDMLQISIRISFAIGSQDELVETSRGGFYPAFHVVAPKLQSDNPLISQSPEEEDKFFSFSKALAHDEKLQKLKAKVQDHVSKNLGGQFLGQWRASNILPQHKLCLEEDTVGVTPKEIQDFWGRMPAKCARISRDCIIQQHLPMAKFAPEVPSLAQGLKYHDVFTYAEDRLVAIMGENHSKNHPVSFFSDMVVQAGQGTLKNDCEDRSKLLMMNEADLRSTATKFLHDSDDLYVYFVAMKCPKGLEGCYSPSSFPPKPRAIVPLTRVYLNLTSKTGPDHHEIMPSMMLSWKI